MQITIDSLQTGPKLTTIQTNDGKLWCWSDKLGGLGLKGGGATFEIETGTWKDKTIITKAKLIAAAPPPAAASNGNGNGHYKPTSPEDSERIFVCSALKAFIQAGKVEPDGPQLVLAINTLREVYKKTFGLRIFTPSDAGHYGMAAE